MGIGSLSRRPKRMGRGVENPPLSGAELKKEYNTTSTPPLGGEIYFIVQILQRVTVNAFLCNWLFLKINVMGQNM
jgi:hypothetical protein